MWSIKFCSWLGPASSRSFSRRPQPPSRGFVSQASRGNYASLDSGHVQFFRSVLGESGVLTEPAELEGPNSDWLRTFRGQSSLLLRPRSTSELSELLQFCTAEGLAVCAQGGNTGFSAGATPVFDEIILSTARMNRILGFDTSTDTLRCEAGCVLASLNDYLAELGRVVPLDLGSKGSCHIGANLATNAGGMRVLRYGSLHAHLRGLEVVLADGTVLDSVGGRRQEGGQGLEHLFLASEGTLGIVTKVGLGCVWKPPSVNLLFLGLRSFPDVLETLRSAKQDLAEILQCCEYVDSASMSAVVDLLRLPNPLPPSAFYMLVETGGCVAEHDEHKINRFLQTLLERKVVSDGLLAGSRAQEERIWALRERIPEAMMKEGCFYAYDFSLPVVRFNHLVDTMREHSAGRASRCFGFGHLGDGNIHFGFTTPRPDAEFQVAMETRLFHYVSSHGGSLSAEHGLGFKKRDLLPLAKSAEVVVRMEDLKRLLDPKGILNPYKIFPSDSNRPD